MTRDEGKAINRLGEVLEPLDPDKTFKERQEHIKNSLARYLNLKTVVALIGAGASIPLGYPSWTKFAKDTLEAAQKSLPEKKDIIAKYLEFLADERGKELSAQVMLGECERLYGCDENNQSSTFRRNVAKYFDRGLTDFLASPTKRGGGSSPADVFDKRNNPYIALLELPVRRFITTNYDLEIERALLFRKKIPHTLSNDKILKATNKDLVGLTAGKSFSQHKDNCDSLTKFPIARYEDNDYMVFHCHGRMGHGRIDDIYSCIITEEDYQRWYLRDDPEFLPFRQTLDLTFSSNPILMIGYGLGDIDLMRWLRTITANRPEDRKVRNPLYCINYIIREDFESEKKWNRDKKLIEAECDALYLKYGLHVITVYQHDPETGKEQTLCDALLELKDRWRSWWEGLLLKPKFRTTPTGNFQDSNYFHYKINVGASKTIKSIYDELEVKLDDKLEFGKAQSHALAIVVGDGGTGKSWSVQKYLDNKEAKLNWKRKKKWTFVFWSSYYANDVLTGIDRLIEYFQYICEKRKASDPAAGGVNGGRDDPDREGNSPEAVVEDRFDRLARFLSNPQRVVIVFDGIEKLLNPNKEKNAGESISPEIARFFKLISDPEKVKCKVILTTRLFPLDVLKEIDEEKLSEEEKFHASERRKRERNELEIIAPRCWSNDLINDEDVGEFSFLSPTNDINDIKKELSPLCSLVDGHIFCIALIRGILEDFTREDVKKDRFDDLRRDIANTPIDRRIYRVIQEAIEHLDTTRYKDNIVEKFIERISLFMHPVRKEVAEVCFVEVIEEIRSGRPNRGDGSGRRRFVSKLLQDLVKKNLLQLVSLDAKARPPISGYVVHPIVRNYVHQTIHKSRFTSLPSLQLPGLTSAMEVVDPGSRDRGVVVTRSLFQRLCKEASHKFDEIAGLEHLGAAGSHGRNHENEKKVYLDLCRGAFSILRARFCANTVTRWGDYREYLKMVVDLYDTSRKVSEGMWRHNEPTKGGKDYSESPLAPLYADEMAWVYNEIGFASFSMGNLLNAIPFREQGLEISRLIDNDKNGRYLFQSEFNLGTAYIFLGRLNYAMSYLERAIEVGNKLDDPRLISRVKAYIALVKYLQGSLEEADVDFNNAYKGLIDNPRARGVFYCYHGELLLKLNRLDEAKDKIDQSRHIGEAEYYLDVVAYARLATANLLVKRRKYNEAQNEYTFALKEAQRTKLHRLETGVLSGMSRLAYELNDSEVAKQRAVEALKIANEYALCLHQTVGLLVLGKALVKEGNQRALGIACLKTAKEMANSQGYFLRKNEAEDQLQILKSV